jgi:hypothetical protein
MPLLQNQIVKEQSPTKFSSGIRPLGRESNRQKNQAFLHACLRPDLRPFLPTMALSGHLFRSITLLSAVRAISQYSDVSKNCQTAISIRIAGIPLADSTRRSWCPAGGAINRPRTVCRAEKGCPIAAIAGIPLIFLQQ